MDSPVYFVENLTLQVWILSVWPRLFRHRQRDGRRATRCYVIDGSRLAMLVAKALAWIAGATVERLVFRFADVRDETGMVSWLRLLYLDLADVQQDATREPVFQELAQALPRHDRLPRFLAKKLVGSISVNRQTTWRAVYLIQVCAWKAKREGLDGGATLVLERRPWLNAIVRYASVHGVTVIPVRAGPNIRAALRRRLTPEILDVLRYVRYRVSWSTLWRFERRGSSTPRSAISSNGQVAPPGRLEGGAPESKPCVGVAYYGQLNLSHPERHSELFFWHGSSLRGEDVLVMFGSPSDPLDLEKWAELREHGMGAVVLHPGATTIPDAPIITHPRAAGQKAHGGTLISHKGPEAAWLREQISDYHASQAYWSDVFARQNVKVYVTWYKNESANFPIAEALQELGGVTAVYQRSYEPHPSPNAAVGVDISFSFSQEAAEVERRSNSLIRYQVTAGYPGDHRFPLLRELAQTTRDKLQGSGARRILAYFDENTIDDGRWLNGHHFTRENYAFLLEKLLDVPWLGLVIKPKTPQTLRRRLGPVAEMLEHAEATGRCYIYEGGGAIQGWYPPAAAALAADVAVHNLCARTAGIEAALAGVPTVLIDREGWSLGPLYQRSVAPQVFTDWEGLWEACDQHWSTPGGIPGFGDWSAILDGLDPFRDGRAAERVGTYIKWLIEGFQAGGDRETVMAGAAERYCALWGSDKVTEVNSALPSVPSILDYKQG